MNRVALALTALCLSFAALAGSWGEGSFENDAARDWAQDCAQGDLRGSGAEVVEAALQSALNSEFIEVDDGAVAVAAAEVIAAARGKPAADLPAELSAWLEQQSKPAIAALASKAREALERVRDPKVSELQQLWAENSKSRWPARVREVESRLGG
jgi:Domain of unknown function (DUF4259)